MGPGLKSRRRGCGQSRNDQCGAGAESPTELEQGWRGNTDPRLWGCHLSPSTSIPLNVTSWRSWGPSLADPGPPHTLLVPSQEWWPGGHLGFLQDEGTDPIVTHERDSSQIRAPGRAVTQVEMWGTPPGDWGAPAPPCAGDGCSPPAGHVPRVPSPKEEHRGGFVLPRLLFGSRPALYTEARVHLLHPTLTASTAPASPTPAAMYISPVPTLGTAVTPPAKPSRGGGQTVSACHRGRATGPPPVEHSP